MRMIIHALSAVLLSACIATAAEDAAAAPPTHKKREKLPRWNVQVEVLMVAMPQEKALALLPALRSPERIDGAVEQILGAIDRKEATLVGYPFVQTLDGQRGVSEAIVEKRYPTAFEPAISPHEGAKAQGADGRNAVADGPKPTAFETRNLGATLEVEPHVSARGDCIKLNVVPQRVVLLGFDSFRSAEIDQPQFSTSKVTTSLVLRNGQRSLLAVHKLLEPANQIEFFIIQAFATPTR